MRSQVSFATVHEPGYESLAKGIVFQAFLDIREYEKLPRYYKRLERKEKEYLEKFPEEIRNLSTTEKLKTDIGKRCYKAERTIIDIKNKIVQVKIDYASAINFIGSDWYYELTSIEPDVIYRAIKEWK